MNLNQLKEDILKKDPRDFVEENIILGNSPYVTADQLEIIRDAVSKATGVHISPDEVKIVGSAKLGFGLFEKKKKGHSTLPAFREFNGDSDIDIAFVSPTLFDAVWSELSTYAIGKPWMPFRMNKLGDYFIYGWIRPDHIPKEARLLTYDSWRDTIRTLTASPDFNRRKLSGAIYRNSEFLKKYQIRGISHCKAILESV